MANLSTDPKSLDTKLHLRWFWDHANDEKFQADVLKGVRQQIGENEPQWKHTTRGVAFSLNDLKEFLDMDLGELLLNTFVDRGNIRKQIEGIIRYIGKQKQQMVPTLFQEYKKSGRKDIQLVLKNILGDYLIENPDIDIVKITREISIIVSLLHLANEGYGNYTN